jgi:hypothetical protein
MTPLEKLMRKQGDKMKTNLKEIYCQDGRWMEFTQDRAHRQGLILHGIAHLDFTITVLIC